MVINSKQLLISSICLMSSLSPISCYAIPNTVPFDKVNIKESNSITAKDSLIILSESEMSPDNLYNKENKGDWTLLEDLNYEQLLSAKTGTEFMNILYPSGIRLPTMLYDPMDSVRFTMDNLPYEIGDGCKLLWLMCSNNGEDRFNFTLAEQRAAEKYYTLMQLKSISLGLPLYSFNKLNPDDYMYTVEQQQRAINYVNSFEQRFGTIYFIDTSKLDYDWCASFEDKSIVIKDKVLPYPLPKGSKTIQVYADYKKYFDALQCAGISENVEISKFLSNDEIKANYNYFIEENESYSLIESILNTGKYYEQLPLYLYDILYIGGDDYVNAIENNNTSIADNNDINKGEEKKGTNDPYFNALRNQTLNSFDSSIMKMFEENNNNAVNYKGIYQNICLVIFCIGAIVGIIIYFLNKANGR